MSDFFFFIFFFCSGPADLCVVLQTCAWYGPGVIYCALFTAQVCKRCLRVLINVKARLDVIELCARLSTARVTI